MTSQAGSSFLFFTDPTYHCQLKSIDRGQIYCHMKHFKTWWNVYQSTCPSWMGLPSCFCTNPTYQYWRQGMLDRNVNTEEFWCRPLLWVRLLQYYLSLSGASGAALSVSLVQEEGHRVAGRVRVPARIRWWGSSRRPRAAPQRVSKLALHSIGHSCDEIWITPAALLFCILWSENRVTVLFTVAEKEAKVGLMILLIPAK